MRSDGVRAPLRRSHEERLLRVLREHGALSRAEIARRIGLSRTRLSEITRDLLERGAIVVVDTDAEARVGSGRPAERLALDPRSGQFLGADFGHRRVRVAVADASHEIIAAGVQGYEAVTDWPDRGRLALELVDRLTAETGVHLDALQGVGIGLPGPYPSVDLPAHARWGPAAHAAGGIEQAFRERFGTGVVVDNNTRFAALAEALESADPDQDVVYVRLGDGVGGGLVVGGRLVTGTAGFAGEFGHVTVVPGGDLCRCGKRGCLETVASVSAILAACRERGAEVETLEDLARAVAISHPGADRALREVGEAVGRVLGAAAVVLNPAEVVVGGAVTDVAPAIVEQAGATLAYEFSSRPYAAPRVRAARLSDEGGALGAIAALFRASPLLASYPLPPADPPEIAHLRGVALP